MRGEALHASLCGTLGSVDPPAHAEEPLGQVSGEYSSMA